uniref:Uncharacterized protein n=1 Tax=Anguilla anguilla TaxID=7936 RepID=A0A0E9UDT2_ANGAN
MTSSANSRDATPMSPNWTHSIPRLRLEILSTNTKNRKVDKAHPWQSLTPTLNKLDLMPRMRTQLSL